LRIPARYVKVMLPCGTTLGDRHITRPTGLNRAVGRRAGPPRRPARSGHGGRGDRGGGPVVVPPDDGTPGPDRLDARDAQLRELRDDGVELRALRERDGHGDGGGDLRFVVHVGVGAQQQAARFGARDHVAPPVPHAVGRGDELAPAQPAHALQMVTVGSVDGDRAVELVDEDMRGGRLGGGVPAHRHATYWNADLIREKSP
jgi:hypothetical protein